MICWRLLNALLMIQTFEQFKQDYGKTIVCGYARIDGWAVGIVANQRMMVKSRKGRNANGRRDL